MQIKPLGGALRPAIVSLRRPIDEYELKIWLLTDTAQRDWNIELRYLRETVRLKS